MIENRSPRWGIISTANIARSAFLPALRAAGGIAYAVAGRDGRRAQAFAEANGIEQALEGYETLLADDRVDAIYNPLPNGLHAAWTIAALRAGKAVLCEKPMCVSAEQTESVLAVVQQTGGRLWEAFVFPFREQTRRVVQIIADGEIGEVREIQSSFHFALKARKNIRFDRDLSGGALYDVGCYPIAFARLIFGADAEAGMATATWAPERVDEEMRGVLQFAGNRRLVFSCGMSMPSGTFTRLLGTGGEIRLTNPFHPGLQDTIQVLQDGSSRVEQVSNDEPTFTDAVRHIHAVLRGEEAPRHLALDDALGNARAIDLLLQRAREGRLVTD